MKKTNFCRGKFNFYKLSNITSIFLIVVVSGLIINSCTKDSTVSDTKLLNFRSSNLTAEQKIAFFDPISKGTFDNSRTFTSEEVVLGIETLLNYEYDNFTKRSDESFYLKDSIIINKTNGSLGDREVNMIYNEILKKMKCHYSSINKLNKSELFVDLYLKSENNSQLVVGFTNVVGSNSGYIIEYKKTFKPGENWNAVKGKCENPNYPSNGAKEVQKAVNWNLVPAEEAGTWYDNLTTIFYHTDDYWFANNENDTQYDGIMDKHEWYVCQHKKYCLQYYEMNYYLGNAEYEAKRYEIDGKKFISILMNPTMIACVDCCVPEMWLGEGNYGIKHINRPNFKELGPCE